MSEQKRTILLFYPPLHFADGRPHTLDSSVPPLGVLYLCAYINRYSETFEAVPIDCGAAAVSLAETERIVKDSNPWAMGISASTPQLQGALELGRRLKRAAPERPVFLGGPHVSADPGFVSRHDDAFDYGIQGEAEKTFLDSLNTLLRGEIIPCIQQSEIVDDLDSIPPPGEDLLNWSMYGARSSMIYSRGCPYRCYYCSRPAISSRIRYRSPENVLDEIMSRLGRSKGRIDFQDDTFTLNRRRVMDLCLLIQRRGLNLDWHCNGRIDTVDEEMLEAMACAGCTLIHFGIETGDDRLRREVVRKGGFTTEDIHRVYRWCRKNSIEVGAYYMIGHQSETRRQIAKTKDLILKSGNSVLGVSIPTPFPGSKLYEIAEAEGIISQEIIDRFAEKKLGEGYEGNYPVYTDPELDKEQVFELRKNIIRSFYLQPRVMWSVLKQHIGSPKGVAKLIRDSANVLIKGSSPRQPYKHKGERLVLVTPFFAPNLGGLETHLTNYTSYLAKTGVPTTVLTYKPLTVKATDWQAREEFGSVTVNRYWWWGNNLFDRLAGNPALEFLYMVPKLLFHTLVYSLNNRKQIRSFHAHGLIAAFIVRITTLLVGRKKSVSTHFIYNLTGRKLFSRIFMWVFSGFDKILAVGDESSRELIRAGCPQEKVFVFKHAIDNKNLFVPGDREKARIAFNLPTKELIVLFVGRLIEMKGVLTLLEAAEHTPAVTFVFVGSGELEGRVTEQAKQQTNVIFLGRRQGRELVTIYQAADMVILPSTEEGSSLVVIEALSCGKPVIVTNKGCSKDMFPNELGQKISPTTTNIISAISRLAGKDLEALGRRTREYALEHYGEANSAEILKITL